MTDMATAVEAARIESESEASREVTAQAAADNPNPIAEASPLPDSPPQAGERTDGPSRDQPQPPERITTADRSRADIAARFRDKRAAQGGQVEFHGDMRDPSQTYGPYAPQLQTTDDGTASPPFTLPLVGRVASEASGVGVDVDAHSRTTLTPTPIPSPQGGGESRAAPSVAPSAPVPAAQPQPQADQSRLVKVKVYGREAWLPEAEVVAEAQKSLAAGNLLESAKEVLAGVRGQMSDVTDQMSDIGDQRSEAANLTSDIRHPTSDPFLELAQTLQLEDAAAAGSRLKQTIESETVRARQEASRQVRIENELAVSQKALTAFEQTHPQLAADDFARDAITTQVQREINADLQAAVNQGILKDLPRTQDERNGLHTQLRAFGAQTARPIGDLFAAAGMKYESWRNGAPASVPPPHATPQPSASGAPRVELTTARQERRAQIPTQPTNGTAPLRGLTPAPELTTAQRRSAAVMAMRKARGQITA